MNENDVARIHEQNRKEQQKIAIWIGVIFAAILIFVMVTSSTEGNKQEKQQQKDTIQACSSNPNSDECWWEMRNL